MAARERNRLTHRSIRAAEAGLHADGDGLMLQVVPSGARTWILRTMVQGRRRDMGLGGWPIVSLKEARDKAQGYRRIARQGGDPFAERDRNKNSAPTFAEAVKEVHEAHEKTWRNKKHAKQWLRSLEQFDFPTLGGMRVDAIKSGDIMRALGPIWLEKSVTARNVLQRIGVVLSWAKGHGFRSDAPGEEIAAARRALPKKRRKVKHHAALPYANIPAFLKSLRDSEVGDRVTLALELLILTATRTNEVLEAEWPEIDLQAKLWTIPDGRMKGEREHRVPLASRAIEILQAARKLGDGTGLVFPGAIEGKPLNDDTLRRKVRSMGFDVITVHGFRSSFRDWCSEQTTTPREVAEAALAHALEDATEAAYSRTDYFEKRRKLMDEWATYCTDRRGEVVDLSRARAKKA